jgi:hypothetical protein
MLQRARKLAVAAGAPAIACESVDRLAEFYRIDAAWEKMIVLTQVAVTARGARGQREVAVTALDLLPVLLEAERFDEAAQLAELAYTAAQKSRDDPLIRRAAAAGQEVEARQP